jgi:malonyl CoA-acyl carrier protein transacylase
MRHAVWFLQAFVDALDCAGLKRRSLEGKKIRLLAGLSGASDGIPQIETLTEHFHFLAEVVSFSATTAGDLAGKVIHDGYHRVRGGATDIAIVVLADQSSTAGGPQVIALVLERARDVAAQHARASLSLLGDGLETVNVPARFLGLCRKDRDFEELLNFYDSREGLSRPDACLLEARSVSESRPGYALALVMKVLLSVERGVFPCTESASIPRKGLHASSSVQPWFGSGSSGGRRGDVCLDQSDGNPGIFGFIAFESPKLRAFASEARLLVFSAPDPASLENRLVLAQKGNAELNPSRLAKEPLFDCRAALVAQDADTFRSLCQQAVTLIRERPRESFAYRQCIFYSGDSAPPRQERVAIMFPGQGSQFLQMNKETLLCFPKYRKWIEAWSTSQARPHHAPVAEWLYPPEKESKEQDLKECNERLWQLEIGGQAGLVSSLAMFKLLESLGVSADCVVGCSNGENAALAASRTVRDATEARVLQIMRQMRDALRKSPTDQGSMLAVTVIDPRLVQAVIDDMPGRLFLALDNCPSQLVLFALSDSVEEATIRLRKRGAIVLPLPFDRPYHTPLFAKQAKELREFYEKLDIGEPVIPIYSCASAAPFPGDSGDIRDLACRMWQCPVSFRSTTERLYADGVRIFIDAGPGSKLMGFVHDTLRGRQHWTCSASSETHRPVQNLFGVLGLLFVRGRWNPERLALDPLAALWPDDGRPVSALAATEPPPAHRPRAQVDASRAAVVRGHFDLMSGFLNSQKRIGRHLARHLKVASPNEGLAVDLLTNPRHLENKTVWDCELDINRHRFLRDHAFGKKNSERRSNLAPLCILPLAYSLELALQAVSREMGSSCFPVRFLETEARRWITLERGKAALSLVVESVSAREGERRAFKVRIENAMTGELALQTELHFPEVSPPLPISTRVFARHSVRWSASDFYDVCLFHGDCFKAVKSILSCRQGIVQAKLQAKPAAESATLLPLAVLDAFSQLGGYWLVEEAGLRDFGAFPIYIGELACWTPLAEPVEYHCHAAFERSQLNVKGDVELSSNQSEVHIAARDMRMRIFPFSTRYMSAIYWQRPELDFSNTSPDFVRDDVVLRYIDLDQHPYLRSGGDIWLQCLAFATLGSRERALWLGLSLPSSQKLDWLMARIAAKDAVREYARRTHHLPLYFSDVEIAIDAAGKATVSCPDLASGPAVFLAQSERLIVAVAARDGDLLAVEFQTGSNEGRPRTETSGIAFEMHPLPIGLLAIARSGQEFSKYETASR